MNRILTYALTAPEQSVDMPRGASILHAHEQPGGIGVSVQADPEQPLERRKLVALHAGDQVPENHRSVAVVTMRSGNVVFVFEPRRGRPPGRPAKGAAKP